MEVASTSFYLDWSFWAVVVAFIAIALSQLPPVHQLLKKAGIDFELYSKISITHKVGNPNLQLHSLISNIGGRKVRIKNIDASIERDGIQIVTLPAQNYLQTPNDQSSVLFTIFSLNPGEDWGHIINLLKFFGREDEKQYRELEAKMFADFRKKHAKIKEKLEELKEPIKLESQNVKPFQDFLKRHFIWLPGEYKLTVNIFTDQESANISKSFSFTLFESHSDQLRAITEKLKYGGGILWEPKDIQQGVIIEIKEA